MFYPPEDIAAGKPARELEIAAAEGRVEDEGWRLRQDGSAFWANVVITVLRDPDGTPRGHGKVTRDLTERRVAELVLLSSEERLRFDGREGRGLRDPDARPGGRGDELERRGAQVEGL